MVAVGVLLSGAETSAQPAAKRSLIGLLDAGERLEWWAAFRVSGVTTANELAGAFAAITRERAQAVFVVASPFFYSERQRIGGLALKHRLPSISGVSDYVEAGGLLSYGPSYPDLFRRAAVYVDKILKGAKPGDLPIEQPTHVSLAVNLRTAKALSLTIPQTILLRAERVIE
jgi:putative ABC transport system substrate-binding protein